MIKLLEKEQYKGYKLAFNYETKTYFDVDLKSTANTFEFKLTKMSFDKPVKKHFTSTLYEPHLDHPRAFGYFIDNQLIGFVEVNKEVWHNVLRITNILVDNAYRRQGIGKKLMEYVKTVAKKEKQRLILLETQTCNTKAIDFYRNEGFMLVGLNTMDYTNHDIEKQEVRIELGFNVNTL